MLSSLSLIVQLLGRAGYLFVIVAASLIVPIECRCGGPMVAPHSLVSVATSSVEASDLYQTVSGAETLVPVPGLTEIPDTMAIGFTIIAVVFLALQFSALRAGPPVKRTTPSLIPWRAAPVFPPPQLLSSI